jgi:hypothetical protein
VGGRLKQQNSLPTLKMLLTELSSPSHDMLIVLGHCHRSKARNHLLQKALSFRVHWHLGKMKTK